MALLLKILKHPKFELTNVPTTMRTFTDISNKLEKSTKLIQFSIQVFFFVLSLFFGKKKKMEFKKTDQLLPKNSGRKGNPAENRIPPDDDNEQGIQMVRTSKKVQFTGITIESRIQMCLEDPVLRKSILFGRQQTEVVKEFINTPFCQEPNKVSAFFLSSFFLSFQNGKKYQKEINEKFSKFLEFHWPDFSLQIYDDCQFSMGGRDDHVGRVFSFEYQVFFFSSSSFPNSLSCLPKVKRKKKNNSDWPDFERNPSCSENSQIRPWNRKRCNFRYDSVLFCDKFPNHQKKTGFPFSLFEFWRSMK